MANLSSLVHELRERIAASSSTPTNIGDDVALETRFRAVLPNLLHAYVVPSPSANEREVIAVLKLISHTARNFPGVFYHGKASAVLPVVGRVLPFFAEPAFRFRHGVIFETIGSLLSLLRSGARDAYRQFFVDSMLVVEDLLYVALLFADSSNITESTCLNFKCFCESFTGISSDPDHLGDLPESNKPTDGVGIMINLTGKRRWRPFATWIIKLLSRCLTEGTLYVEGLIHASFVSAACCLLCYGDADLQMACFDFARIMGSVINYDILSHQNLIQSISTILNEDKEGLPVFRNMAYDSSLGGCLRALHSSCADDVVKLTAADLVNVFLQSMWRTKSQELKVALCNAYIRIAKICPPHVWRPESLIHTLCFPEPCFLLIDCFRVALSILGPDSVGGRATNCSALDLLTSSDKSIENLRVGEKRPIPDVDTFKVKRQKLDDEIMASDANVQGQSKHTRIVTREREDKYANDMHKSLISFVKYLNSPDVGTDTLSPHVALTALSMLCIAFSRFPDTNLSIFIFQQMYAWIPRICELAKQENSMTLDVSIYLEGIHSILLLQSTPLMENKLFKNTDNSADLLSMVLKLPWSHSLVITEPQNTWKTKCISVQVASKLGSSLKTEIGLEVLDLSLRDEVEEVRLEAVVSMPVIVFWSGLGVLTHIFRRVEAPISNAYPIFAQLGYENPREAICRIACANCHLANKPVDIEVPQAVLPDTVFEAVDKAWDRFRGSHNVKFFS